MGLGRMGSHAPRRWSTDVLDGQEVLWTMKDCPCRMVRLGLLVAVLVSVAVNATAIAYESVTPPRGEDWTVMPGWWDTGLAVVHYQGADNLRKSAWVSQEPAATPAPPDPITRTSDFFTCIFSFPLVKTSVDF